MNLMNLPSGMSVADSTSGAEWVRGRDGTYPWATVAEAFPPGFTEFVRVLHPAPTPYADVTWRDAFAARQVPLTPQSSWFRDIGDHTVDDFQPPEDNSLPQTEALVVASILLRHTTMADDCWFEWSPVRGLPFDMGSPLVEVRNAFDEWRVRRAGIKRSREANRLERSLPTVGGGVLLRGSLSALTSASPSVFPAVWWPADRAWVCATAVDSVSTYIAASATCVNDLLAEDRLETMRVSSTDTITI